MRSITGSNIRRILLLTKKDCILQVTDEDIRKIEYSNISDNNVWRVKIINEITNIKFGKLVVEGFTIEECEEILEFACIS